MSVSKVETLVETQNDSFSAKPIEFLGKVAKLARLKFLLYSPIAFMTGCSFAFTLCQDSADLSAKYVLGGLVIVYLCHIMTHFFNEYYDLLSDSYNSNASPWTGGSRVLPSKELPPELSYWLGVAVMIILAISTVVLPNRASVICLLLILVFSNQYSAPPFRLQCMGLGEATVGLVLNTLTPLFGFFMAQGRSEVCFPNQFFWSTIAFNFLIEHSRMMVMNMADVIPDLKANKTTLVVRLGVPRAKRIYRLELMLAYFLLLVMTILGLVPNIIAFLFALTFPAAELQARTVVRSDYDAPFWASQFNALCMAMAYLGSFFIEPFSIQVVQRSYGLILLPLLPIVIVQRIHLQKAILLRLNTPR